MKKSIGWYLLLQLLLFIYACGALLSKLASGESFGIRLIAFYVGDLLCLGIYAIGWQKIIKHLPLTLAYANKAITVVWGALFGLAFFGEKMTIQKVIGAVIVILGVIMFTRTAEEKV